ncbi:MAG TPA: sulfatase-like hydrolase/transferase [Flavobacterium sp.]
MNLRSKIKQFIFNDHEYPIIAGFCIGFYMLVFYYSNNFKLAHSWQQLLFFIGYYILVPVVVLFIVDRVIRKSPFAKYNRQALFVVTVLFFLFFVLQNIGSLNIRNFGLCCLAIVLLSFKFKNYKALLLVVLLMSIVPILHIGAFIYRCSLNNSDWNVQPDAILDTKFAVHPNVYFIEVDGYANDETLKSPLYRYDNSKFDNELKQYGFTLYDSFRSNYNSTLLSNASIFTMRHHYTRESSNFKYETDYIMDDNAVLKIFKNNGYKTFFITERPYLIMNRPDVKFDYCNFKSSELPYLKDGWVLYEEITNEIKSQIIKNKQSRNFFFIQKFDPGHIAVSKGQSRGRDQERTEYLKKLEVANLWLSDILAFIQKNDPKGLVIIGADHSGYVGFAYTHQVFRKIHDRDSLNSIFGAKLAVKWNDPSRVSYDKNLKTNVNLFRVVFSFLSRDSTMLNHLQPDVSYHNYDGEDMGKIYKAIE